MNRAALLEKLTSDLHDLIFDVQEERTFEQIQANNNEAQRIARVLERVARE